MERVKNTIRSTYSYSIHGETIAIVDHDIGRSVTNDIDNVLQDLRQSGHDLTKSRVIYQDTRGIWDEVILEAGKFAGFRCINTPDMAVAVIASEIVV